MCWKEGKGEEAEEEEVQEWLLGEAEGGRAAAGESNERGEGINKTLLTGVMGARDGWRR